jgi:hypothetical protein
MRALGLSLFGLSCVLMLATPTPATSQPSGLAFGQMSADGVEEVGYRYRRYRYGMTGNIASPTSVKRMKKQ